MPVTAINKPERPEPLRLSVSFRLSPRKRPEFTSRALGKRVYRNGEKLSFITGKYAGQPVQEDFYPPGDIAPNYNARSDKAVPHQGVIRYSAQQTDRSRADTSGQGGV